VSEIVITLFGSSSAKPGEAEYAEAAAVGRMVAEQGWTLLNGGYSGTMYASAEAARQAGGATIGVTLSLYRSKPNAFLSEEIRTNSLLDRLEVMLAKSSAFLVLLGGTGTLAEVGYVWEMMNKNLAPQRPLVFIGDYWQPLVDIICPQPDARATCGGLVRVVKDAEAAVEFLKQHIPPCSSAGFQPAPGKDAPTDSAGFQPAPQTENKSFQAGEFIGTSRNLPHQQEASRTYFITFTTKSMNLTADYRGIVLDACLFWNHKRCIVHACVVMPDHVHLLLTPLRIANEENFHNLSEIMKSIKGTSARNINKKRNTFGSIWLSESYDRAIRTEMELKEKWEYIRNNPVKGGLADTPENYEFLYEDFESVHEV
jgi:putative transposase